MRMYLIAGVLLILLGVGKSTGTCMQEGVSSPKKHWSESGVHTGNIWNETLRGFENNPCDAVDNLESLSVQDKNESLSKLAIFLLSKIESAGCSEPIEIAKPVLIFKPRYISDKVRCDRSVVMIKIVVSEKGFVKKFKITKRIAGGADCDELLFEYIDNLVFVPAKSKSGFVEYSFDIVVRNIVELADP